MSYLGVKAEDVVSAIKHQTKKGNRLPSIMTIRLVKLEDFYVATVITALSDGTVMQEYSDAWPTT